MGTAGQRALRRGEEEDWVVMSGQRPYPTHTYTTHVLPLDYCSNNKLSSNCTVVLASSLAVLTTLQTLDLR